MEFLQISRDFLELLKISRDLFGISKQFQRFFVKYRNAIKKHREENFQEGDLILTRISCLVRSHEADLVDH